MPYTARQRKLRQREAAARWRARNVEKARAACRLWLRRNSTWSRRYAKAHRKQTNKTRRLWAAKNPAAAKGAQRRCTQRLKLLVLGHYGGAFCRCCKERDLRFLTLDHVNNDGNVQRRAVQELGAGVYAYLARHKYPQKPKLQVLCYNCNLGRAKNSGTCPHKDPLSKKHLALRLGGRPRVK